LEKEKADLNQSAPRGKRGIEKGKKTFPSIPLRQGIAAAGFFAGKRRRDEEGLVVAHILGGKRGEGGETTACTGRCAGEKKKRLSSMVGPEKNEKGCSGVAKLRNTSSGRGIPNPGEIRLPRGNRAEKNLPYLHREEGHNENPCHAPNGKKTTSPGKQSIVTLLRLQEETRPSKKRKREPLYGQSRTGGVPDRKYLPFPEKKVGKD